MKKPDLSVIVPVYNAAATLDRTLGSLVDDQFGGLDASEWEIVAVDDGSSDNSLERLRQWEERYPDNIKVITGSNGGVSHARNRGIEAAAGEWIAFVDADDYLLPGSLRSLLRVASVSGADTVRFGFRMVKPGEAVGSVVPEVMPYSKCTGLEFLEQTRGMIESRSQWNACFGLFSRRSIGDIRFPEGLIVGEDCLFTWDVLLRDPQVALVDEDLYIYIQYPSSTMNNQDPVHLRRMMEGRRRFCNALLELRRRCRDQLGPRSLDGLGIVARNAHNEALINSIILGDGFGELWESMRQYKDCGLPVKPGRPRFYDRTIRYGFPVKFRRWITAYLIPVLMGVSDVFRGQGMWSVKHTD